MHLPVPLRRLLQIFNASAGSNLNVEFDELTPAIQTHTRDLLVISSYTEATWRTEVSLIALWRAFLSLIPASVLERPEDPCKEVVEKRLQHILGEVPSEADVDLIVGIIKRMQRHVAVGRRATSLDLDSEIHAQLLRNQSGRCANCGYKFLMRDIERYDEVDETEEGDEKNAEKSGAGKGKKAQYDKLISARDQSPDKLNRRPALDHIFPVYLAGDSKENWQVLCYTCNGGKSDMLYGFEGRAWFGGARKEDLLKSTPQLFYMTLRRDTCCVRCQRGPKQVELRIVRKDVGGANLFTNLSACCVECLKAM